MRTVNTLPGNLADRPTNRGCIETLKRNNRNLKQLERKFTSYIYEPTTYSLFSKSQKIREALSNLKNSNAELITLLNQEGDIKFELFEKTMLQIRSFMEIQKLIDDYSKLVRH
ncbi:hypothetical protein [Arenibacter latericius]|uniref:hypothetical protein n=1 Tax=Arenibacter latericius TaxID=86104 RepID=UPI000403AA14|nr:hypothetical protein [Arenibacter latericius]MDX1362810.1 hypothetical protein [Arenibacter latericius]